MRAPYVNIFGDELDCPLPQRIYLMFVFKENYHSKEKWFLL